MSGEMSRKELIAAYKGAREAGDHDTARELKAELNGRFPISPDMPRVQCSVCQWWAPPGFVWSESRGRPFTCRRCLEERPSLGA